MNRTKTEKSTVHYKGRHRSIMGKVSLSVGIIAAFFLVFLIFYGRANPEKSIGGLGIINGLLAIAGTMCAATARRETPFQDGFALSGMVVNLIVIVVTLGLFLVGAAL
ncbi:MAG: hypothetical protein IKI15_08855 [Lachnospiraceae bacterium]|nr:hypothetical protein [Lachnospiraceae bacterium]